MTNEEARERIDCIIMKHEVDDENVTITNEKDYDALRVAYKILEQDFYMMMNDDDIKILLDIDRSMECALESDPRTITDRTCEYGWLFNAIHEWRKKLKGIRFLHDSDIHAKGVEVSHCWKCSANMVEPQKSEDKE